MGSNWTLTSEPSYFMSPALREPPIGRVSLSFLPPLWKLLFFSLFFFFQGKILVFYKCASTTNFKGPETLLLLCVCYSVPPPPLSNLLSSSPSVGFFLFLSLSTQPKLFFLFFYIDPCVCHDNIRKDEQRVRMWWIVVEREKERGEEGSSSSGEMCV